MSTHEPGAPEPTPDGPGDGKMRPLSVGLLLSLLVAGAGAGWVILELLNRTSAVLAIGWVTPLAWLLIAVALAVTARVLHLQIQVRRAHVDAQKAVTALACARAGEVAGALFCGGYAAWAVLFGNEVRFGAPTHRVWACAVSAVLAALACVAGVLLERACRVPKDNDSATN